MSGRSGHPVMIVAALALLAGAMLLQVVRDREFSPDARQAGRLLYVRSGPALRRIALEFDALAADVYWIRTLQHFGGERLLRGRSRNYDLLYPLLDLATALDPYFTIAYRFGAIFLSEPYPGGPGRPDEAIALLGKGVAAQPTRWQYYHDIAFVHYWHLRDYKGAAAWFQRAADQPNAPNWLAPLVPVMLNAGGDRASARLLWTQILHSEQEWLRRTAQRRLQQLDALDQIDALQQLVRNNPPPAGQQYSWRWLIARRVLPGVPVDPARTPYTIDPSDGKVGVSLQSELQPMPDEGVRPPS